MNNDTLWCHDCDAPADEFYPHARAGHAVTFNRCPGKCQFQGGRRER